jgi:hypothetical protein
MIIDEVWRSKNYVNRITACTQGSRAQRYGCLEVWLYDRSGIQDMTLAKDVTVEVYSLSRSVLVEVITEEVCGFSRSVLAEVATEEVHRAAEVHWQRA